MHKDLKDAIVNNNLILFVGAGMSMPLGFPNWTQLILEILDELKEELGEIQDRFNFSYYKGLGKDIDVFDVLTELERCNHKQRVKNILNKKIDNIDFRSKSLERHKKLWEISSSIITTNYDKVLDEAKPKNIKSYTNNNIFQQWKSIQGNPFLYKIHGDIDNPDTCILFTSDYEELYTTESSNKETLKHFFRGKTILFVGFSLDDPFIKKQLEYIHKLYNGYTNTHFLISNKNKDFSELNIKILPVDNWHEAFDEKLDELIGLKGAGTSTSISIIKEEEKIDITSTSDRVVLDKLLEEKKEEFEKAESYDKKKLSKELYKIRDRILGVETEKLNVDFQQLIPNHKEAELEYIFSEIFKAEKLSDKLVQDINNVREQHSGENDWYHRSVLVSALACSLINFKKLDPRKLDLLVDFANDNENKVWQKAVTYLFLVLMHLGNKWLKYEKTLEPKFIRLREQPKIQEALKSIISLMQHRLQGFTLVDEKIFKNEYFKDNPFNYFLPFYIGNPSIDNLYENEEIDNIKDFINFLYDIPLSDSFKYLLCNSKLVVKETEIDEPDEVKEISKIMFDMHNHYQPYLNNVNDFLNFYKHHPNYLKEVKQDVTIIKIKNLKNLLLNAVEERRAMAQQFMLQKNWGKAILQYEALIKIKKNDKDALYGLLDCYENTKKNNDDKLKLRLRIEEVLSSNHENLYNIAKIYGYKKKYKKAFKYVNKAIKLDNKQFNYYNLRGIVKHNLLDCKGAILDFDKAIELEGNIADYYYHRGSSNHNLKDYEGAILDFDKAIELDNKQSNYYNHRGSVKHNLKDYEGAILDYDKAIELDNKQSNYYGNRGGSKHNLKDYEGAILDYDKAIEIDNNYVLAYINKANSYRLMRKYDEAKKCIDEATKLGVDKGKDIGSKAAIYASEGNDELFYEYLEKAFEAKAKASWLDDDIKEKYKAKKRFQELLSKYNLTLEDED